MSILDADITQTCECGNDTYHIKMSILDQRSYLWAECTECGRPTASVGDLEPQLTWEREQE